MIYYDTTTSLMLNSERVKARIGTLNGDTLGKVGIYPLEEVRPDYNPVLYELSPAGKPKPKLEEPNIYQLNFIVVPRDLDSAKYGMKEKATAKRWKVETGGITLADGTRILTGIEDQNRIATSIQGMRDAGTASVDFKAASGWVTLTLEQLVAVSVAIVAHVEACFSHERALYEAIDAAVDVETLGAIDINAGWPGKEVNA